MAKSTVLYPLLLTLILAFSFASSARLLDELDPQAPVADPGEDLPALPPLADTTNTLPSGQAPATTVVPADTQAPDESDQPQPSPTTTGGSTTTTPASDEADQPQPNPTSTGGSTTTTSAPADTPTPDKADKPQPNPTAAGGSTTTTAAPADSPAPDEADQPNPTTSGGSITTPTTGGPSQGGSEHPTISFYMHDVLGGSQASGRIVTGIVATTDVNGIPFSRPNNQVFPVTNGVPLNNGNLNNLINNNNAPFLGSLNGQTSNNQPQTVIQNAGTNTVVNGGNNNQAFVTPGQLPSGATLQKLMFGSITVIDDELTEGHELGSAVIGKGEGFYLASSLDGESHTMAFTAVFHGEDHHDEIGDTLSFFGVHRTASPISQIAIIGGTGKFDNAKGYATIETLPQEDQHTTDGVDTIAHISVYLV